MKYNIYKIKPNTPFQLTGEVLTVPDDGTGGYVAIAHANVLTSQDTDEFIYGVQLVQD